MLSIFLFSIFSLFLFFPFFNVFYSIFRIVLFELVLPGAPKLLGGPGARAAARRVLVLRLGGHSPSLILLLLPSEEFRACAKQFIFSHFASPCAAPECPICMFRA